MSPVVHVLVCIFLFFYLFLELFFLFTGPCRVVHPQFGGQHFYLFHHPHNFDTWSSGAASEMRGLWFPRFYCYEFERLQTCGAQQALSSLVTCSLVATTKHSHTTLRDTAGVFRSIDPKPTAEDHHTLLYLLHF